jgi:hypothetical protein
MSASAPTTVAAATTSTATTTTTTTTTATSGNKRAAKPAAEAAKKPKKAAKKAKAEEGSAAAGSSSGGVLVGADGVERKRYSATSIPEVCREQLGQLFAAHSRLQRKTRDFHELLKEAGIDVSDSTLFAWRDKAQKGLPVLAPAKIAKHRDDTGDDDDDESQSSNKN